MVERVPEVPAAVAELRRLSKDSFGYKEEAHKHIERNAATLIESLERQRQEEAALGKTFSDIATHQQARAEQAEKDLAEALYGLKNWNVVEIGGRGNFNVASYCDEWEDRATAAESRLAKLEAVVTAHKATLRSEETMRQWDGWRRALRETPDASAPRDMFEAWIESICTDIDDALAALDRKEHGT